MSYDGKMIRQNIPTEDLEEYEELKKRYTAPTAASILHLKRMGFEIKQTCKDGVPESPPVTEKELSAHTTDKIADIGVRLLKKKVEEWSEKEKVQAREQTERRKRREEAESLVNVKRHIEAVVQKERPTQVIKLNIIITPNGVEFE